MNKVIQRIHDIGAHAWLLFVQWLNGIAATLIAGIIALNAAYPQFVLQLGGDLPAPLKLAGAGVWALAVHYALRRAKKAV